MFSGCAGPTFPHANASRWSACFATPYRSGHAYGSREAMDGIRVDRRPRIAIAGLRQPPRRGEDYRRADDRVCAIKPGAICPDCAEVGQWSSVSANVVKLHSQGPETVAAPVNVGVPGNLVQRLVRRLPGLRVHL